MLICLFWVPFYFSPVESDRVGCLASDASYSLVFNMKFRVVFHCSVGNLAELHRIRRGFDRIPPVSAKVAMSFIVHFDWNLARFG